MLILLHAERERERERNRVIIRLLCSYVMVFIAQCNGFQ